MVKAFRFRLDRLLDLRRMREETAQRDLAEARGAVLGQNRKLLGMLNEREEGKGALREMRTKDLDLGRLRFQEAWLESLERRIREGYDLLHELVRREIGRRQALTEAARGVQVLERLRERRYRDWQRGLDREERKTLDEVAQRMERAT